MQGIKTKKNFQDIRNEKNRKVKFEIKRVYTGEKPIGEVFGGIIEYVVEKNLEECKEKNITQE